MSKRTSTAAERQTLRPGDLDEDGWLVGDVSPGSIRTRLLTQTQFAELINISERQVRNLEEKGLPNEGFRGTKVYPLPVALWWMFGYWKRLAARDGSDGREGVRYLDWRVARAMHDLDQAETAARFAALEKEMYGRELTDAEVEALADREQYLEGAGYLEALLAGKPRQPLLPRSSSEMAARARARAERDSSP